MNKHNQTGGQSALTLSRTGDIGIITLDVPGERVNTLRADFAEQLRILLARIRADDSLKGLVLCSGKPDSFVAGADIHMLAACGSVREAAALARTGQQLLAELEAQALPLIAAIHGPCLGGGLELALACHGRICSDADNTRLGLPEVQLGLLPGSGGTQRLPRLIGLTRALDMMLTGRSLRARAAVRAGLVDDMVPESILLDTAIEMARQGKPRRRRLSGLGHWLLEANPLGRKLVFDRALGRLRAKTGGHYPAPETLLEVVRVGLAQGMASGLHAEAEAFGELVMSPQSAALRHLFFATTEMKKDQTLADPQPLRRVGVLGGGLMGGGIAYVTATRAALPVRIKEIEYRHIGQVLAKASRLLQPKVSKGYLRHTELQKQLSRITGTLDYSGFDRVDLVVEAVVEDLAVKQQMVVEIETHCPAHTIFATNTSSLPIHQVAAKAQRPERILGLHYFSPVDKMPLVEIIPHADTAPRTVATAIRLARAQGKTPIVVGDKAGFYVNRILAPYLNEAVRLLLEGEPVEAIDSALVAYGFPLGPFSLLDQVGIDVAAKIAPVLERELGPRFQAPAVFRALLDDNRHGKKNGRGFYRYDTNRRSRPVDQAIYALLDITAKAHLPAQELAERCVLPMLNEAALCLDEGVIGSARDGDIGAVYGVGFPPFLGGPFHYMQQLGPRTMVEKMQKLSRQYGERFTPCVPLQRLAERSDNNEGEG